MDQSPGPDLTIQMTQFTIWVNFLYKWRISNASHTFTMGPEVNTRDTQSMIMILATVTKLMSPSYQKWSQRCSQRLWLRNTQFCSTWCCDPTTIIVTDPTRLGNWFRRQWCCLTTRLHNLASTDWHKLYLTMVASWWRNITFNLSMKTDPDVSMRCIAKRWLTIYTGK